MAESTSKSTFRADEVLDMAIRIENQGVIFYEACLAADPATGVKMVFQYLLDQEHEHIRTFEEMRQHLSDYRLPESYAGETESYMKSFVNEKVFITAEKGILEAEHVADPFEAIDYGLEFENRSIIFYQEMKKLVPESEREAIEKVIDQERDHKRKLESLHREISKQ